MSSEQRGCQSSKPVTRSLVVHVCAHVLSSLLATLGILWLFTLNFLGAVLFGFAVVTFLFLFRMTDRYGLEGLVGLLIAVMIIVTGTALLLHLATNERPSRESDKNP